MSAQEPPRETFTRQRETKDDGRYVIYYAFSEPSEQPAASPQDEDAPVGGGRTDDV